MALVLFPLGVSACGGDSDDGDGLTAEATDADASSGPRTIEVVMDDNAFSPARVEVAEGETVTFAFTNEGSVTHDAVMGDRADQEAHEAEMRAAEDEAADDGMDGMDHGSEAEGDEAAVTVGPGATGELTHTFARGDEVLIGCHEPGHYDAGMTLDIAISPA